MRAKVDKDLCASCGVCAEVCPEVFIMNDEEIAEVRPEADPVPTAVEDTCRDAADQCPAAAIEIED